MTGWFNSSRFPTTYDCTRLTAHSYYTSRAYHRYYSTPRPYMVLVGYARFLRRHLPPLPVGFFYRRDYTTPGAVPLRFTTLPDATYAPTPQFTVVLLPRTPQAF